MKINRIYLLLVLGMMSCLKEKDSKRDFSGFLPENTGDGVPVSTPAAFGFDQELLGKAYELIHDESRYPMARSLLVYKEGFLIAESYPNDPTDRERIQNIQSCTKSVTSLLMGIALKKGYFQSLQEPLYEIYPEEFDLDVRKRGITMYDALTMQTGLEFDNGIHTREMIEEKGSVVKYVLAQKYLYPSGLWMNYNDGAPHLVARAIEKKTGIPFREFAERELLHPLGIRQWQWETARDGSTFGAFSLYLRPRDLGRIGLLMMHYGDTLLDSATYMVPATNAQVSAGFNNEPYGFYFWNLPVYKGFAAYGHGGQFVFVVPEKQLVVVYTAWPYTSMELFDNKSELMRLIYEASP